MCKGKKKMLMLYRLKGYFFPYAYIISTQGGRILQNRFTIMGRMLNHYGQKP